MTDDGETTTDRSDRPTFVELADWVEGRLTRADALTMERRVANAGPDTARTVEWIRGFARFGRQNPLPAPPPLLRQRLRQSFERRHGRAQEPTRVRAVLSFDSRDDVVLSGVRGGFEIDDGYRLAFAADALGVLIDVLPEPSGEVRLDGQVLGVEAGAPIWQVDVDHPGGSRRDVAGDEDGCFSVRGVPLDASRLMLSNGLVEIEILRPLGEPDVQ